MSVIMLFICGFSERRSRTSTSSDREDFTASFLFAVSCSWLIKLALKVIVFGRLPLVCLSSGPSGSLLTSFCPFLTTLSKPQTWMRVKIPVDLWLQSYSDELLLTRWPLKVTQMTVSDPQFKLLLLFLTLFTKFNALQRCGRSINTCMKALKLQLICTSSRFKSWCLILFDRNIDYAISKSADPPYWVWNSMKPIAAFLLHASVSTVKRVLSQI